MVAYDWLYFVELSNMSNTECAFCIILMRLSFVVHWVLPFQRFALLIHQNDRPLDFAEANKAIIEPLIRNVRRQILHLNRRALIRKLDPDRARLALDLATAQRWLCRVGLGATGHFNKSKCFPYSKNSHSVLFILIPIIAQSTFSFVQSAVLFLHNEFQTEILKTGITRYKCGTVNSHISAFFV